MIRVVNVDSRKDYASFRILAGSPMRADEIIRQLADSPAVQRLDPSNGLVIVLAAFSDQAGECVQ